MRRDSREDSAAAGDLAATHGRAGEVQTVAAASRVPGPPQGALQRRQLNERRGAERRSGAAERTGTRVASRTLLGQGESDRPGREKEKQTETDTDGFRGPGKRKCDATLPRKNPQAGELAGENDLDEGEGAKASERASVKRRGRRRIDRSTVCVGDPSRSNRTRLLPTTGQGSANHGSRLRLAGSTAGPRRRSETRGSNASTFKTIYISTGRSERRETTMSANTCLDSRI